MDALVQEDLKEQLVHNLEAIGNKYASYVSYIYESIKEKISVDTLQVYLLHLPALDCNTSENKKQYTLLYDVRDKLRQAKTVKEIFVVLSEHCSFLNYYIYKKIQDQYKIAHSEELRYPDDIEAYVKKHKLSEFVMINSKLADLEKSPSAIATFKFDIPMTSRIAKVLDLKKAIAKILHLKPSALRLYSIEEGCVEVRFLIPSNVAEYIFKEVTPGQKEAFEVLSVICYSCEFSDPDMDEGVQTLEDIEKPLEMRDTTISCFEHVEEEINLYCETCGVLLCLLCVRKHHDHDCSPLKKAFERYKEEMISFVEPLEKQVTTIKKALAQLDRRHEEIFNQQAVIEDNVHVTFRRLREVLHVRETEIIDQLHQTTQRKLKDLAVKSNQIETTLAKLNSCLHFIWKSLKTGNEQDVLMMKTNTVNQAKELTTPFQPDFLKPDAETDLVFSASADTITSCKNYGQIIATYSPDPSKCHVTGKGAEVAAVKVKSTAILHAVNFAEEPCEKTIRLLECELVSEITGTRAICSVEKRVSQYEISYQPTIKGRHQFHVKVEGQHVRGSPFSLAVKSPVEKLGTPILTIGGLDKPRGVAINKMGEVVVTECGEHCVSVFSRNGAKLRSFGARGSGHGQFDIPSGVAVDGEGNILVADCRNHRIQKFTSEGLFLTSVGTKESRPLQFDYPIDIALNASINKVYVLNWGSHHVQVLNSDLTFSSIFGKEGRGKGQFISPRGIACDSTGNVYVADTHNHRIQVFTAEGNFMRMFGRCGQGKGEFSYPGGIAIDTSDLVYVSDSNYRVSVFTTEGQSVLSFGMKGKGPGEFDWPSGLAVDDSGVVYVCDLNNSRVQVF